MSIELAGYGFVSGFLKKKTNVYVALIGAQIVGRFIGALGSFIVLGLTGESFAISTYIYNSIARYYFTNYFSTSCYYHYRRGRI